MKSKKHKADYKISYVRMPLSLKKRLDQASLDMKKSKSQIVVEALEAFLNDNAEDFSFMIEALEELKDGDHKKASKKIDAAVKILKQDD